MQGHMVNKDRTEPRRLILSGLYDSKWLLGCFYYMFFLFSPHALVRRENKDLMSDPNIFHLIQKLANY